MTQLQSLMGKNKQDGGENISRAVLPVFSYPLRWSQLHALQSQRTDSGELQD